MTIIWFKIDGATEFVTLLLNIFSVFHFDQWATHCGRG